MILSTYNTDKTLCRFKENPTGRISFDYWEACGKENAQLKSNTKGIEAIDLLFANYQPPARDDEPPNRDKILAQCLKNVSYLKDLDNQSEIYGIFPDNGPILPLGSTEMSDHMQGMWIQHSGGSATSTDIKEAMNAAKGLVSANAEHVIEEPLRLRSGRYAGEEIQIALFTGENQNEVLRMNPQNGNWGIGHIGKDGVGYFKKSCAASALPRPIFGENCIDDLWGFMNLNTEEDRVRVLAIILLNLSGARMIPILSWIGGAGSAKTTQAVIVKQLTDPFEGSLEDPPVIKGTRLSEKALTISASIMRNVIVDNASHADESMQDTYCGCVTGGKTAERLLYSNGGMYMSNYRVGLQTTSVTPILTRPDVLDRAVVISCNRSEDFSIPERTRLKMWSEAYPRIFSSVITLLSRVVPVLGSIKLAGDLRMADYIIMGEAIWRDRGHTAGGFEESCREAIGNSIKKAGEGSAFISWLVAKSKESTIPIFIKGTSPEIFEAEIAALTRRRSEGMPKTSSGMDDLLVRYEQCLVVHGIGVNRAPDGVLTFTNKNLI